MPCQPPGLRSHSGGPRQSPQLQAVLRPQSVGGNTLSLPKQGPGLWVSGRRVTAVLSSRG